MTAMRSKAISVEPSLQVRSFAFHDDLRATAFADVEHDGTGVGRRGTAGTAAMRVACEAEFSAAQDDLLLDCPTIQPTATNEFERLTTDVVVLSQSCDLANEKLKIVQVCPLFPLEELAAQVEQFRSKRGREELRRGYFPGFHLLNHCEIPGHESDFWVCDFRSLFGVHVAVAKSLAVEQSPRLRILPPYREHLAQAFARFFMRVGLPVDVPPFA